MEGGGGMSVKSKPYYWVVCDWPGCGMSAQEGSDYSAWSHRLDALEAALDADWWIDHKRDLHYCDNHPSHWCSDGGSPPDGAYLAIHDGCKGEDDSYRSVTLMNPGVAG
jgi:hypothetical protein